jgi:hypothetical protein
MSRWSLRQAPRSPVNIKAMGAPRDFTHQLEPDLFALDRLEALCKRAPGGAFGAQLADEKLERPRGAKPVPTTLEATIAEEVARRPLHLHFHDVADWAPEYRAARDHVLELAADPPEEGRYFVTTVIRVFTAGVPVSLHADGETQIDCGVGGRNTWHFFPPDALSEEEHEWLLRGGQFLTWRTPSDVQTSDLKPGDGVVAPPRWLHWIEHPGDDPAVSFEVGYWTAAAVRERKVYEVNWLLRRARLHPKPPGASLRRDRVKRRTFDLISRLTRKGAEFRGV